VAENWEALFAAHLRFEHGVPYRKIAARLNLPEKIIKDWIAFYEAQSAEEEAHRG